MSKIMLAMAMAMAMAAAMSVAMAMGADHHHQPRQEPAANPNQSFNVRRIATGINIASAALKGFKAAISVLHSSPAYRDLLLGLGANGDPILALNTAKIIAKAFKVSRTIAQKRISNSQSDAAAKDLADKLSTVVKGCKAFYGAFTVLQLAKSFGFPLEVVSMFNWNFLLKGYKLSKSMVNVMEVMVGLRGGIATAVGNWFLVMKGTVQGIGVMMKAAFLSKEICIFLLKAFGISRGGMAALEAISEALRERPSHDNLSKRVWCTLANEKDMDVLLRVIRHKPPLFDKSELSSSPIMLLVKTLADAHRNLDTHHCVESGHLLTFSLAVPLPTIE